MKKLLTLALVLTLLTALFVGCSSGAPASSTGTDSSKASMSSEGGDSSSADGDSGHKIGFSHINLNMAWMAEVNTLVEKKADELGIELISSHADNDPQQQITDVENLLAQDIDGLLLAPVDGEAAIPAIEQAKAQGVPVVVIIRSTTSTDIVSFITGDDIAAGEQSAQFIVDELGGEGKVVELVGALGASPFINRSAGFNDIMAENTGIEIVAQQNADSLRTEAVSVMETILTAQPEIDFVFGANDEMALGAYEAVNAAGRAEDIKIITVGGHIETYTAIKEGRLHACIAYPTTMGPEGLQVLVDHLDGKEVEEKVVVPVAVITAENVQDYIDAAE